jgi:hypothetical protein
MWNFLYSNRWARIAAALPLCALLASCGRSDEGHVPVFPAEGRVKFNGKALPGAMLSFHSSDKRRAAAVAPKKGKKSDPGVPVPGAVSLDDGSFSVSTYEVDDGLPPGVYRVTVSCENRAAKMIGDSYTELLPARYQNPELSGLEVTVEEGVNDFPPLDLNK